MKRRIFLMSDIHLCHIGWYGIDPLERMKKLVEDVKNENKIFPIDAIFILGDMSLDYWECPPYGSYSVDGISNTARFLKEFASDFPCKYYFIPGNHEQYTHDDWKLITGAERQFYVLWDDIIIFMLDNFGDNLNASEHNHGTYSYTNVQYVRSVMSKYSDKRAILCAHDFDIKAEPDEFAELVRDERIIALFAGHNHRSDVNELEEKFENKKLIRTGQYSYTGAHPIESSMWGFRELVYENGRISTAYITPENIYIDGGNKIVHKYGKQDKAILR